MNLDQLCDDYKRIELAIGFLENHTLEQPDLSTVAGHVGLSEYHFQRLFTRWAGISPKRFLQFLTRENVKKLLSHHSILSTAIQVGLSGPGRLHDLLVSIDAVSPGEFKSRGEGMQIRYGFHPTPFGTCLLAITPRGICKLAFTQGEDHDRLLTEMYEEWRNATFIHEPEGTAPTARLAFSSLHNSRLTIHLRGTNFQLKVWEALLQLPAGEVASYEDMAAAIGHPGATRCVGTALSKNPVAYLIPCHRVLRKTGDFGEYRYGSERKKALLLYEQGLLERLGI